jgi:hypothetical protein
MQEAGKMAHDYFALLGLSPGEYDPAEVTRRFRMRRAQLIAQLDDGGRYAEVREKLDQLHLAYAALRSPRAGSAALDPQAELRELIAASLEDGLLRHSRRQHILETAREVGISDFQAQLLIADVQFGQPADGATGKRTVRRHPDRAATVTRVAGIGALAAAIFLMLVRWIQG